VDTKIRNRMKWFRLLKYGMHGTGSLGNSSLHLSLQHLFYSRVESNAEMMAEKALTVKQALTITDVIELLPVPCIPYFSRWNRSILFRSIPDFSNHPTLEASSIREHGSVISI